MKQHSFNRLCRIFLAGILFLFLRSAITFGQKKMSFLTDSTFSTEWWFSLIKKHNIDPDQFTFGCSLKPGPGDPGGYTALELGRNAFMNDSILTIKDPLFLIKETGETYTFVTAKSAIHKLGIRQIKWENGKVEEFKFNSTELTPVQSFSFEEFQFDLRTKRASITNIAGKEHK